MPPSGTSQHLFSAHSVRTLETRFCPRARRLEPCSRARRHEPRPSAGCPESRFNRHRLFNRPVDVGPFDPAQHIVEPPGLERELLVEHHELDRAAFFAIRPCGKADTDLIFPDSGFLGTTPVLAEQHLEVAIDAGAGISPLGPLDTLQRPERVRSLVGVGQICPGLAVRRGNPTLVRIHPHPSPWK